MSDQSDKTRVFFVRYLLKPAEENKLDKNVGGAIAKCYLMAENNDEATGIAKNTLRDYSDWETDRLDGIEQIRAVCFDSEKHEAEDVIKVVANKSEVIVRLELWLKRDY